jgi:D-ornithine 4,5-aminomutase subunit alpha
MRLDERADDFEARRAHLSALSDEALHARFWALVDEIVAPLVEEARTHTSPSIERSVLLRMGLSSLEAKRLVEKGVEHGLLGRGMGRVLLEYAQANDLSVHDAANKLLEARDWSALVR